MPIDARVVERVSLHFVGGEGLLLDPQRQQLYSLNASAALIWSLLKEGKSADEAGRTLHEHYAVPIDRAALHVAAVLDQFAAGTAVPHAPTIEPPAPPRHARPAAAGQVCEAYILLGVTFAVTFENALLRDAIAPLLEPARAPTCHVRNGDPLDIQVQVEAHGDGAIVVADGGTIGWCDARASAAVATRAALTQLAVRRTGGLCVIHSGALCRNGGALLLPGAAGHGKSTLSAGLAAHGFEMLSDDTSLLGGQPLRVRCLPTGLCIKRGAYPVLEPRLPTLASLPEWERPDGRIARYLVPGRDLAWASPDAAEPVRWMVFPRYHPDAVTALRPLPRHEAIARLLPGVCFLDGALDADNLETLIAWIEDIDCFELPLSSLDAAGARLDELCR